MRNPVMKRIANLLFCAVALAMIGLVPPAFADDAAEKEAARKQAEEQERKRRMALEQARKAAQENAARQQQAVIVQFEQQFAPQFRQLYRTEMHFMRIVCQPTRQQYEKIAAEGEAGLKEATKKYAVNMRG